MESSSQATTVDIPKKDINTNPDGSKAEEKEPEYKYDRNAIMQAPPHIIIEIYRSGSFHAGSLIERMIQLNMPLNLQTHDDDKNLLHYAVEQNDLHATHVMLCSRAVDFTAEYRSYYLNVEDPCLKKTFFGSPLVIACSKKNVNMELIKMLLDAGAYVNINMGTLINPPPIFLAVRYGNVELFDYLMSRGADFRILDLDGRNILFEAAKYGQLEFFDRLLSYGIDPTHVSAINQSTILHEVGKIEPVSAPMLRRLLDMNLFDPNRFNKSGRRPIDYICSNGDRNTLDMIIKYGGNPFLPRRDGLSCFTTAVRGNNMETLKMLAELGVRFNPNSEFPLEVAITLKNHEMIDYLFSIGLAPDAMLPKGESLLVRAVKSKDLWIVDRFLATNRVHINMRNAHNQATPLIEAAVCKAPIVIVQRLLERGADVRDRDNNKETALHYAAGGNQANLVYLLLRHGADVNAESATGIRPLDLATDPYIIQILKQHGATTTSSCWKLCCCCCFNN